MVTASPETSQQTRAKLLASAGELFAEKGFDAVTVREICAHAGANVAAVNYHFGDKQSLYCEVVKSLVAFVERAAFNSQQGPPEEQFRQFVSQYLQGLLGAGRPAWALRLVQREFANPTPALKQVVDVVIRPTEQRLCHIIGQILGAGANKETIRLCAHSVIGQCLHYRHAQPVFVHLWPSLWDDPNRLDELVHHITTFSLAAFRQLAGGHR